VREQLEGKEIVYECEDEAEGIARCKDVCRFHFNKLKQDNLYRIKREMDIPETTDLMIKNKIKWLHVKRNDIH
jgi:hypothetical protein